MWRFGGTHSGAPDNEGRLKKGGWGESGGRGVVGR